MSKRKDHLKALFGGGPLPGEAPSPAPADKAPSAPPDPLPPAPETKSQSAPQGGRSASGAVKAMGLTLNSMSRELDEARAIKESLTKGERVVEIDPELIDPSLVRDRLSHEDKGDEAFQGLVDSMRENGQQVPVLLRPHPTAEGRYQVAYGHRRVRAAARLGQPVKAIVRTLTDDELVLAQGKENTERRNLSFIERAFFAHALIAHGFERGIVQRALSIHKAEMTRLLAVAGAVPADIARAIGPAPKAGRPRWLALAEFLKREAAVVMAQEEIRSGRFADAGSDERFRLLFDRLAKRVPGRKPPKPQPRVIEDGKGRIVARLTPGERPQLEFDEKNHPGLAAYVAQHLPELARRLAEEGAGE
ncbi:plasmid partitioning protein RepB [Nitratireductor luteus]|uniref:plasmid partitioning protein RepB n=1 Tax=Nitratireductor luteus TaxID=2976980 RepID=UPI00223FD36F|nr:plasmid partitioning protein RepB [Nitratireductor luteus]